MVELGRSVGRGVISAIDEYHRTHLSNEEYRVTRMLVMLPGGVIGIEHPDAPRAEYSNDEAK